MVASDDVNIVQALFHLVYSRARDARLGSGQLRTLLSRSGEARFLALSSVEHTPTFSNPPMNKRAPRIRTAARIPRPTGTFRSLTTLCLPLVAGILSCPSTRAAVYTWDAGGVSALNPADGTGSWDGSTADWSNGATDSIWSSGSDAIFGNSHGAAGSVTVGTISVGNITFNPASSGTYTLASGTLTLTGGTITVNSASATINSVVTGGVALVKSGTGTLVLGGTNTYSGGTVISQGTLQLTTAAAAGTGAITLSDSSTGADNVQLNVNTASSISNAITVGGNGSGTETISLNSLSASTTWGSGAITVNGALTLTAPSASNYVVFASNLSGAGSLKIGGTNGARFDLSGTASGFTGAIDIASNSVFEPRSQLSSTTGNAVNVETGGVLQIVFSATSIDSLTGAGTVRNNTFGGAETLTIGKANGSGTFTGSILNNGNTLSITKTGTGTEEFSGSNFSYTGATTLTNGTLELTNATGFASNVAVSAANTVDFQLNAPASTDNWTFSKQITGGSANAMIEKVGLGTVTLNPASGSTYIGGSANALTVTAGTLNLASSFSTAPAVSVASGATFGGAATVGSISVAGNGTLIGGNGSSGQTSAAGIAFAGAGLMNIGTLANYSSSTAFNVSGSGGLVLNGGAGSVTISVGSVPTGALGTYKLIGYSGAIGGAGFGGFALAPLPSRAVGSLVNNAGEVDLSITGTDFIKWTGVNGNAWDTFTTNWILNSNGSGTTYIDNPGDTVVFDDSASSSNTVVNIGATVHPSNVTFSNSTNSYILQGSAGIAGATTVTLNGNGIVTISTPNSYSGQTTLGGATLNLNNASAIGSGTFVINAGTIDNTSAGPLTLTTNNPQTWSGNFTFGGTQALNLGTGAVNLTMSPIITVKGSGVNGTLNVGGAIAGAGFGLTKAGNGTLVLGGASSYSGGVVVSAGSLQLNNAGAAGTGLISLGDGNTGSSNVTLNVNSSANISNGITVTGSGTGTATINLNSVNNPWTSGTITLNGPATLAIPNGGGAGQLYETVNSALAGNGTLTIGNTNNARFILNAGGTADSGFTGAVDVSPTAIFEPRDQLPSATGNSVTVEAGGVMQIVFANTTIDTLNGAGTVRSNAFDGVTRTLTIGKANGSGTFTGTITNNGGVLAVTKAGTGTETFTGANTYTGATTVNAGTLIVSGSLSGSTAVVGGGTLEVAASGTLSGPAATVNSGTLQVDANGTISSPITVNGGTVTGGGTLNGALTINSGGTLNPGQSGAGLLSIENNLTLNAGGHLAIDLSGPSQCNQILYVGSSLTLGGDLQLILGYTPSVGDVFYLLGNLGGNAIVGTFSNAVDQGNGTGLLTAGGNQFLVSYTANAGAGGAAGFGTGLGNDIALEVISVPEPVTFGSLLGGGVLLAGLGRFRRRK